MFQTFLLFTAQHDAQKKIDVFYRLEPSDGSKGASILINGKLITRLYNPMDVTKWFAGNSLKNLPGWIKAYHSSALSGKDWARPSKIAGDINLQVPYHTQRDNERFPGGTCNVTSYAMDFDYLKVPRRKVNDRMWTQREDELSAFMEANHKDRHSHADLDWMAGQYGLDASFRFDRTWDAIRTELRAGFPVIVSGLFTRAGHIILLRGCQGEDFLVNDPWGNALTKYRDRNGQNLVYPFAYMDATVRGGHNSKWAHFLRRKAGA